MHRALDDWYRLWNWLIDGNASRATVILVFVTILYVMLNWRMARAVAQQTRAMIQPVLVLGFHWQHEEFYPVSYFEIRNVGTQPLLLLDVKLWCGCAMPQGKSYTKHYTLWDEHILAPGKSLRPEFDFKEDIEKDKLPWSPGCLSYALDVVASDLSKQVVLSYTNIPVLHVVNVRKGLPLAVRWRYFRRPFASRYYRLQHWLGSMRSSKKKTIEQVVEAENGSFDSAE